jgi:ubiquinone/menaquinone biosynthesis C-methylase UbiE
MFDESSRYYDLIYSFKDYAAEAQRVVEIVRSRVPDAQSLLDVACGTGAHMEHWRGIYQVEGVDINEDLLGLCRDRNPDVALHVGDMRTFELEKRFDAIVCLFSAIGYMTTVEDLRSAVSTMSRHLNPGGALIVEPWLNPATFEEGRVDLLTVDQPNIKIARASYAERDGGTSRIRFDYLVTERSKGTRYFTELHEMGLFTSEQYISAFEKAGLVNVEHDEKGLMGRGLIIGSAP